MPQIGNLRYPETAADELIDRMKQLYDCKTDRQLAEHIGVNDAIFARWRNRNTFHKEVLFAVAFDKGVSVNYLLFGKVESTISVGLTDSEREAVDALCKEHGLTETGLVKFAIRLYQEICERFANGERIEFVGNRKTPVVFIAPMLGLLRARHAPRKPGR